MSKIRFLGCIFGGAVLCIYYANEFSILSFSYLIFILFCFVLFVLICFVSIYPKMQIRYHVTTLSSCHIICGCRFENLPRCEVVLRWQLLQLLGYFVSTTPATPAACR